MSTSVGICGVYGVLLDGDIANEMVEALQEWAVAHPDCNELDIYEHVIKNKRWAVRVREMLIVEGIKVPNRALLHWTGSGESRPAGRCETETDAFILGYGIYTKPCDWADEFNASAWDDTWRKAAFLHTWVWQR